VSFITPCFSKLGSSPNKTAEYLAMGLPTVLNRGIGDGNQLIDEVPAMIDAGGLGPEEIERADERQWSASRSMTVGIRATAACTNDSSPEVRSFNKERILKEARESRSR